MSDTDITMSLDDTLELDTIIKKSNIASNPVGTIKYEGSNSTVHNYSGIQTNTYIFDPQQSGTYTIPVNGQELTVEVTNPSTIPDTFDFENQNDDSGVPDGWEIIDGEGSKPQITTNSSYSGDQSLKFDLSLAKSYAISPDGDWSSYQPLTAPIGIALRKTSEQGGGANIGLNIFSGGANSGSEHIRFHLRNGLQTYPNGSRTTLTTNFSSGDWVYVTVKNIDPSNNTYTIEWNTPNESSSQTGLSMINDMSSDGYDDIRVGAYESTGNIDYIQFG